MTQPFSLACLDLAGTVVNETGSVDAAFTAALKSQGITPDSPKYASTMQYVADTMGQSKVTVLEAILEDKHKATEANAVFETAYHKELADGKVTPLPGAEDAIATLKAAGAKVCFTTGFSPGTRDALLASLGWDKTADLVLSPADAGRGRPYPDMILTAVLRLEIDDVAHVVAVGDTVNDLLAARRAGCGAVVGVLTGAHDRAALTAAPHTHIADSVADVPSLLQIKHC